MDHAFLKLNGARYRLPPEGPPDSRQIEVRVSPSPLGLVHSSYHHHVLYLKLIRLGLLKSRDLVRTLGSLFLSLLYQTIHL